MLCPTFRNRWVESVSPRWSTTGARESYRTQEGGRVLHARGRIRAAQHGFAADEGAVLRQSRSGRTRGRAAPSQLKPATLAGATYRQGSPAIHRKQLGGCPTLLPFGLSKRESRLSQRSEGVTDAQESQNGRDSHPGSGRLCYS